MSTLAIVLAVILVLTGVVFRQRGLPEEKNQVAQTPEVLSQAEEEDSQTSADDEVLNGDVSPSPPLETAQPSAPTQTAGEISAFRYPGSQLVSSSQTSLSLESADDTDRITDWYEEKIRNLGMSAKSFVKTRTNDNVLNKLVGADGEKEIRVEIAKKAGESVVKISVTINRD